MNNDDLGASIGLVDDNDLFKWSVIFEGPEDTLYEGGYFRAELKFPDDYPNNPPEMKFLSKMWHPNIYNDGKVCISILHPPGTDDMNSQEKAEEMAKNIGCEGFHVHEFEGKKWYMPSRYYTFKKGNIEFFALDANVDKQTKKEIRELVFQKNKFDFNFSSQVEPEVYEIVDAFHASQGCMCLSNGDY